MTPEEQKAKQMYDFFDDFPMTVAWKKQCSIYCVDEILKANPLMFPDEIEAGELTTEYMDNAETFWNEVKNHINKM